MEVSEQYNIPSAEDAQEIRMRLCTLSQDQLDALTVYERGYIEDALKIMPGTGPERKDTNDTLKELAEQLGCRSEYARFSIDVLFHSGLIRERFAYIEPFVREPWYFGFVPPEMFQRIADSMGENQERMWGCTTAQHGDVALFHGNQPYWKNLEKSEIRLLVCLWEDQGVIFTRKESGLFTTPPEKIQAERPRPPPPEGGMTIINMGTDRCKCSRCGKILDMNGGKLCPYFAETVNGCKEAIVKAEALTQDGDVPAESSPKRRRVEEHTLEEESERTVVAKK